jgi:outer membrane protein
MTASAGYNNRSNDAFGFGFTQDGKISSNPTASSERAFTTGKASFSWNVLDFGQSYFRAKLLADQTLVAEERQRKAQQNLVQDVRQAFWRAYSAQVLLPEFENLMNELASYSIRVKIILDEKLLPPAQAIALRRSLIEFEQQLALRAGELTQSRFEFANLLNMPQNQPFTLVIPPMPQLRQEVGRRFTGSVESLDMLALEFRPELREEGYRMRQTELEKSRAQLQAFLPGISLDLGAQTNSNRYLLNDAWAQVGAEAALNMVKLFSLPAIKRSADVQKSIDEARRMALAASVLAQIRISVTRFDILSREYEHWVVGLEDDRRLLELLQVSAANGVETEFEVLKAKARLLMTKINFGMTYAILEGAMARVHNSVGLDFLPAQTDGMSLNAMTERLTSQITKWEASNFRRPTVPAFPSLTVRFSDRIDPIARTKIRSTVAETLKVSRIELVEAGDYKLDIDIDIQSGPNSRLLARILAKIMDKNGVIIYEFEQRSALAAPISPSQWAALGQGVAINTAEVFKRLVRPDNVITTQ